VVRTSNVPNVFSLAAAAGLTTAALAWWWISELYQRAPFEPFRDLEYDEPGGPIHHGRFYQAEEHPDEDVINRAVLLTDRYHPDYLLVHPMGADRAGHHHGVSSHEYGKALLIQDERLSVAIPHWLDSGCTVIVSGDHGAGSDRLHGGTHDEVRLVPFYAVLPGGAGRGDTGDVIDHTQIAPTICTLLRLDLPETMQAPPIDL
jgi:predicted AlkP superfamily pyrophosphatase or phosphodiesterase